MAGKEPIRVFSTVLILLSAIIFTVAINSDKWILDLPIGTGGGLNIAPTLYEGIFWSCIQDNTMSATCFTQPATENGLLNLHAEASSKFTFLQVFAIVAIALMIVSLVLSLSGQDSMTLSSTSEGKNRNAKIAGITSFLSGAIVFTVSGIFYSTELSNVTRVTAEMSSGLIMAWVAGFMLICAAAGSFLGGMEEREDIEDEGYGYDAGQNYGGYDQNSNSGYKQGQQTNSYI